MAPKPVKVAGEPLQTIVGELEAVTVGVVLTVTVTVCEFVQPVALVPLTVYIVVPTGGVTTTVEPTIDPGFHVYEAAPLALRVDENPEHITEGEATGINVGVLTIKVTVADPVQLPPLDPVTV